MCMRKRIWHGTRGAMICAAWIVMGVVSLPAAAILAIVICPACYLEFRQAFQP